MAIFVFEGWRRFILKLKNKELDKIKIVCPQCSGKRKVLTKQKDKNLEKEKEVG